MVQSIKFIAYYCNLCENIRVSALPSFANKIFIFIFGLLLLAFSVFIFTSIQNKSSDPIKEVRYLTLEINDTKIGAELAKTAEEITKGLSGRDFLSPQSGMLFYLGGRRIASFWMKDMRFPLDIIWINEGRIVYIVKNAPIPKTATIPTFTPDKPATHVLEVNAGFVEKNGIKLGDFIEIPEERRL